jgi:polyisoprenoid-binding protein YceI
VSATGSINRRDFGMQYHALLETGGVAVSDKVKLEIEVQATS